MGRGELSPPGLTGADAARTFDPPRLSRWLVSRLVGADRREEILRDLAEVGARLRTRHGSRRARWRYRKEAGLVFLWRLADLLRSVRDRIFRRDEGPAQRGDRRSPWSDPADAGTTPGPPPSPRSRRPMGSNPLADIRIAWRSLAQNPGFTAAVVVTLALGIGANTAVFTVVNEILIEPLPYRAPDRIGIVWADLGDGAQSLPAVNQLDYLDYRERTRVFEELTIGSGREFTLGGEEGDPPELVYLSRVAANFFDFFGVEPAVGRDFRPEEDVPGGPRVVMLGHDLWSRRYGADPGLVGETVDLNGTPHEVVGVLPDDFELLLPAEAFLLKDADVWVPVQIDPAQAPPRNYTGYTVFGRLRPEATFAQAQEDMDHIEAELRAEHAVHEASNLQIRVVPLHHDVVKGAEPLLLTLLAAVGFVLLIACANVAHLVLVRGRARQHEIAVRAALGAGSRRLVWQVMAESVLLALAGGGLGLLVARAGLELLEVLPAAQLPRASSVTVDATVLGFAAAVSLLTALLFGAIPALRAGRVPPAAVLKDGLRGSRGRREGRVRDGLVIAEVALSMVLLVGAGLMIRTFANLQEVRPGFDPEGVLTFRVSLSPQEYPSDEERIAFFTGLRDRLAALPGVSSAGAVSQLPLTGSGTLQPYAWNEETAANWESVTADARGVLPGYFEAMGIELLAGRAFTDADTGETRTVIVVDETLVERAWPDDPVAAAVGRRLQIEPEGDDRFAEIVGVVRHVRMHDLTRAILPQIYSAYGQSTWNRMAVTLRAESDPAALAAPARQALRELDPGVAVADVVTLERLLDEALGPARFSLSLMAALGGIALVLAAVGIYGVISYSVSRRTREIGIRLALGAEPGRVRRLVLGRGLRLLAASLVVGASTALLLGRWLEGFLYGVEPSDPLTLASVAGILAAVAVTATLLPARRATRVDPVEALTE